MSILLDTNVLTRSVQIDHSQFEPARHSIERLIDRQEELCILPQDLYEFWSVATRPRGENGLGMTVSEAENALSRIKHFFTLYRDERGVLQRWERLVASHDVKGKTAHDARLVAAMLRHGIGTLLTFNVSHFVRFSGITVLTPEAVLQTAT